MSSRRGRPPKNETIAARERLIVAATELFLADGYAATSMDAVAAAAGASKRTLYQSFPSKHDLFHHAIRCFTQTRVREVELSVGDAGALEPALLAAGETILRLALTPEVVSLHRLLMGEARFFPELPPIFEAACWTPATEMVAGILRRLEVAGDPAFLAEQFISMISAEPLRRLCFGVSPDSEAERVAGVAATVTLFLGGCRAGG